MNKQKQVFLMLGLGCWHEDLQEEYGRWSDRHAGHILKKYECGVCQRPIHEIEKETGYNILTGNKGSNIDNLNPDLTTWAGFGLMWEAAQKKECWDKFKEHQYIYKALAGEEEKLINPTRFLDALHSFGVETGRIEEE